jgi:hypothetical protein
MAGLGGSSAYDLTLSTANGEALRVDATTGNVGIGTTSPGNKLEVDGSAGKPGGGSWSNSSDRRLKKDIKPMEDSLEKITKLNPVTFK